jgi:alkanesulfonate monooxygenase SsuD/methylene tetrahydromethanopterin reductase-like flavin-dependent oxidoreductase (luciferase family)
VRVTFFHLMPWTGIDEAGRDWPVPNKFYDPVKGTDVYKSYLDTMAYAEDCGFDQIGCNEHHFSPYGLMANPNLIAAILATRTRQVKIAVLGNLIALSNPIRIAEEFAMLDVISGGRLVAGFMRGIPHEYVAYNTNPSSSYARMQEATQLIIKAWTEPEPFGWEGEFYQFRAVSIWPRPIQKPHPRVLMSASNPDSAAFAGRNRAMMGIVQLLDLSKAQDSIRAYKDAARSAGWEPTPDDIMVGHHTCICETDEEAREHLREGHHYLHEVLGGGPRTAASMVLQESRFYINRDRGRLQIERRKSLAATSIDEAIEKGTMLCGSPETVVKQIKRIQSELGHRQLQVTMKVGNLPDDVVTNGMRLFKDRVMPEIAHL